MSLGRGQAGGTKPSGGRRARRARRVVGGETRVRVVAAEPRTAPANRQARATFEIAAPRLNVRSWRTPRDWSASRPKIVAGLLVALLLAALYAMFNLDLFFIAEPQVAGNRIVPSAEIQQASGMRGWNIFFVEPELVKDAVQTLPEFQNVQVYATLPNVLEIFVTERQPRFVWEVGGKDFWVDEQGIAMRPRGRVANGWQVRDADGQAIRYGERVNPDAFNAVVSLVNVWKQAPRYFEWTREHGLTLHDEHGWLVYFGSASQMEEKVTALTIVTTQLLRDKKNVAFIDLGSGLPYYQEAAAKGK